MSGYMKRLRSSSPRTAALHYARRGWRVFPIHHVRKSGKCSCGAADCKTPGKHPRTRNGFKDATTNEAKINEWWGDWRDANVGISTGAGSGLLVIDVDPRSGGDESLSKLIREHGRLPGTVKVRTGGGGKHYYFSFPKESGITIGSKLGGFDGLDWRGDGGYVVAPPSNHVSGDGYTWFDGHAPEDIELAEAPLWIIRLISKGSSRSTRTQSVTKSTGRVPDTQARSRISALAIKRGCSWMAHCVEDARTLPEQEWYAMAGIVAHCKKGEDLVHKWSRPHPKYTRKETDRKIAHALKDAGPRTCADIRRSRGGEPYCSTCPHWGRVTSPIQLGDPDGVPMRVAEAREQLQSLDKKLKKDLKTALTPEVVGALALVKDHDPGEWAHHKSALSKAGVSLRDLEREMQMQRRANLRLVSGSPASSSTPGVRADAGLGVLYPPGAPQDLVLPDAYRLASDATSAIDTRTGASVIIAHAPILVTGRLIDVDDGAVHLNVEWRRPSGWRQLVVDRRAVLDSRQAVGLADRDFPIGSTNAGSVVAYLHEFEAANLARLPTTSVTSHLGWQGKHGTHGFLWGRHLLQGGPQTAEAISFRGLATGDEQIASAFVAAGTLGDWLDGVAFLKRYPRALFILWASFVPPLLDIIDGPNFIVDIANRTSSGKTTSLRIAASVWGQPSELQPHSMIRTWDATPVSIERTAAVLSGLPLILDETKRAKRAEDVSRVLYQFAQGQGRGRGNTASLAAIRTWRSVMLSSGEAPATSFTQDGGTRTRVLEIRGAPFGERSTKLARVVIDIDDAVRASYGHAGPAFVQWLCKNQAQWQKLKKLHQQYTDEFRRSAPSPESGRLAPYASAVRLAGDLAGHVLGDPWGNADPVTELWPALAREAVDASGGVRALQAAHAWAESQRDSFYSTAPTRFPRRRDQPHGGWLGRWDTGGDFIAFEPSKLQEFLTQQGHTPTAILDEWRSNGWLIHDKGHNTSKNYSIRANRTRLIVVRMDAIHNANQ